MVTFGRAKDSTQADGRSARGKAARASGYAAEEAAATWLEAQGVRVLERNVRFKGGEIDLVIDERGTTAFVEVRLRTNERFGGAAASVTTSKQQRIALAAQLYLQRRPRLAERPCRFDCVLVDGRGAIEWVKDAFRL
jgi:putative endonuclease